MGSPKMLAFVCIYCLIFVFVYSITTENVFLKMNPECDMSNSTTIPIQQFNEHLCMILCQRIPECDGIRTNLSTNLCDGIKIHSDVFCPGGSDFDSFEGVQIKKENFQQEDVVYVALPTLSYAFNLPPEPEQLEITIPECCPEKPVRSFQPYRHGLLACSQEKTCYHWKYGQKEWRAHSNPNNAHIWGQLFIIKGRPYLMGGSSGSNGNEITDTVEVYDEIAQSWSIDPEIALPIPLRRFVLAALNMTSVVMFGGQLVSGPNSEVVYLFNSDLRKWVALEPMFYGMFAATAISMTLDGSPGVLLLSGAPRREVYFLDEQTLEMIEKPEMELPVKNSDGFAVELNGTLYFMPLGGSQSLFMFDLKTKEGWANITLTSKVVSGVNGVLSIPMSVFKLCN